MYDKIGFENNTLLVSILIPAFNAGNFIQETLESVLAQTYPNIEIIVVDDGSTDDTQKKVLAFGDQIKYIYQPNGGIGSARNRGMALAQGQLIALLDADDISHPDRIAIQVDYLQRNPDIILCSTDFSAFNSSGHVSDSYIRNYYGIIRSTSGGIERLYEEKQILDTSQSSLFRDNSREVEIYYDYIYNKIVWGNFVHPPTVMLRRSVAEIVGSFDEKLFFACDYDWLIRISRLGKIGYIEQPLLKYRLHMGQSSSHRNNEPALLETIAVMHKVRRDDEAFYQANRQRFQKRLGHLYLDLAYSLTERNRLSALGYLLHSLRYPFSANLTTLRVLAKLIMPSFIIKMYRYGVHIWLFSTVYSEIGIFVMENSPELL